MAPNRPRVLVVEDDTQLAHLYCTALSIRGMAVQRAADGLAALRMVEQHQPDLVVLDLMMPKLDGWTLLRDFADKPSTRDMPVVVVTGVDPTPTLPQARAILAKPCDPAQVVNVVVESLRSRSTQI
jgi:CheY-like chemotaxis protein